jgi:hypothetical protein
MPARAAARRMIFRSPFVLSRGLASGEVERRKQREDGMKRFGNETETPAKNRNSGFARILLFAAALGLAVSAAAQQAPATGQNAAWPKARPADVASVDAVVRATYDAISSTGSRGPDMKRFQSLFTPQARLIDVSYREGKPAMKMRTIQEFVDLVSSLPARRGRYEREIARRTERYGNLVQVWSTNKFGFLGKPKPDGYGINSITLSWDGTRWWIIAVSWKNQTPGQNVPAKYMPRAKK